MAEQSRWISGLDVLSKVAIGAIGVFATLYFGDLEQKREASRDATSRHQVKSADERELMRIFADYSSQTGKLDTIEGRSALALASYAADRLAREHDRPEFAELIAVPSQTQVAAAVAENPAAAAAINNVALQAAEAAAPAAPEPAGGESDRWFAVAASFGFNDRAGAEQFAATLKDKLAATAPNAKVEVMSTRVSRKLAVVVGGLNDETRTREMVAQLRAGGLAPEAFAQRDRSWAQAIGDDAVARLNTSILRPSRAASSVPPRPVPRDTPDPQQ